MKETDLQTLEGNFKTTVENYKNCSREEKETNLNILQKEANILSSEEKRKDDISIQKERFQLDKDHTYCQDTLEQKKFEHQVRSDCDKNKIETLKIEIEKQKLEFQQKDLLQKRIDSENERKYRWITFAITTGVAFAQFAISMLVYRKLAYTNLKLIYCDEGRPTTDYKDAIKCVKNMIK